MEFDINTMTLEFLILVQILGLIELVTSNMCIRTAGIVQLKV